MSMDLSDSYVRTCHDFAGAEQGDLGFSTGDVLYIDRQIDRNWCHGQSLTTGLAGIFPSNFVTKLNLPKLTQSSSQKLFIARDRFIGQQQGDLSFLEGDIIVGLRSIDANWWEGEAGGRRGIFPLTFALELSTPRAGASSSTSSNGRNAQSANEKSAPLSVSVTTNELRAKVKHDLRPVDAQELELKAGEIVIIEEFVDKFTCRGRTVDGRRGLFGKGFVEIVEQTSNGSGSAATAIGSRPSPSPKPSVSVLPSPKLASSIFPSSAPSSSSILQQMDFATGLPKNSDLFVRTVSPVATSSAFEKPKISPKPSPSPKLVDQSIASHPNANRENSVAPYGRTKYKFEAEYPGELAFPPGMIIQLTRHVDDEWTEGILDGRRGIFPTSYVDIVVDCPRLQLNSPRMKSTTMTTNEDGSKKATEKIGGRITADSGYVSSGSEHAIGGGESMEKDTRLVKFDFMGIEDGDLTAFKGDPIVVVRRINEEWLEAKHVITGQIGVIPSSFVEFPEETEVKWRRGGTPTIKTDEPPPKPPPQPTVVHQTITRLEQQSLTPRKETRWSPAPSSQISPVPSTTNSSWWAAPTKSTAMGSPAIAPISLPTTPQSIVVPQQQTMKPPTAAAVVMAEPKRSTPPPRPAIPVALKMRQETASQHLEMQRQQQKEQKRQEMRHQRTKVNQEVISTEREYGKDMTFFQDTVHSKRNMLDVDGLLGGTVWSSIIDLSARLLESLEHEADKDFVYQEMGSSFLALSDDFKRIYGAFCQSHEESHALLEKYETEPEKQTVLRDMLTKVQQRTTCIDLSTMLSRPVQRVLKYPLFLGELLKLTEDNQSDKVQLMKALKVMTEVAQTMNESKRRKDLVTKYHKDGEMTFSERLSRFTLHSVRKKSTRLSMRLSSTIGLTQLAKDDQFEDAERQFRAVDRCCRNFLRDVQSYCEQIVVLYNHRMSIADALNNGIYHQSIGGGGGTSPRNSHRGSSIGSNWTGDDRSAKEKSALSARYLDAWSKILLSESILQKFFDAVNVKVRQPLAHIQHACKGPERLISKRGDKLLDFESVAVKLEDASSKNVLLEEELRKAKAEYEAMNVQLLTELPQFNRLAQEIVTMAVRAFIATQRTFVYEFGRCFEQTIAGLIFLDTDNDDGSGGVLEKFQRKHRLAAERTVGDLCFPGGGSGGENSTTIGKSSGAIVKRQISTVSRASSSSSSTSVAPKSRPTITFPQKLQTENDRNILRTQYKAEQLFVAAVAYEGRGDLELALKHGDLVGVIVEKDPMGSDERWFVDSGVSKGFVPRNVLSAVEPTPPKPTLKSSVELIDLSEAVEKKRREPTADILPSKQREQPRSQSIGRRESPLIFLPTAENQQQHHPSRQPLRRRTTTVDREPSSAISQATTRVTTKPPPPRPNSTIETQASAEPPERTYATMEKRLMARRPAPAPPPKEMSTTTSIREEEPMLQPVRPAPRPPPSQTSSSTTTSSHNPATMGGVSIESTSSSEEAMSQKRGDKDGGESSVEFYVAVYSFGANSENELTLNEGQLVAVHDKKDLEANPDWWLVEDEEGQLGYVPGNYLVPYDDRRSPRRTVVENSK